jgi:hypothetical protein
VAGSEPAPHLSAPSLFQHEGKLQWGDFALDPVTWHTLARHGMALRGRSPADLEIWTDPAALASWTLENLDLYWEPWLRRFSRSPSIEGLASLGEWAPAWGVLGVSRVHYTLATGEITSKEGAGLHALRAFPERWHRVIHECLRIRRGAGGRSPYRTPIARRRDALGYIAMAIDEAQSLGTGRAAPRDV